jgi:hypothetical protein
MKKAVAPSMHHGIAPAMHGTVLNESVLNESVLDSSELNKIGQQVSSTPS